MLLYFIHIHTLVCMHTYVCMCIYIYACITIKFHVHVDFTAYKNLFPSASARVIDIHQIYIILFNSILSIIM